MGSRRVGKMIVLGRDVTPVGPQQPHEPGRFEQAVVKLGKGAVGCVARATARPRAAVVRAIRSPFESGIDLTARPVTMQDGKSLIYLRDEDLIGAAMAKGFPVWVPNGQPDEAPLFAYVGYKQLKDTDLSASSLVGFVDEKHAAAVLKEIRGVKL